MASGAELHWGELGQPPQLDLSVLKYLLSSSVTFSSSGGFDDTLDGAMAAVWLLVVLSKVDDNVSTGPLLATCLQSSSSPKPQRPIALTVHL
jgi:hypothetical protein